MLLSQIVERLQADLHDLKGRRYTLTDLLAAVSDGQRAVVLLRPDAKAIIQTMRLVSSTQQTLPPSGVRFLGVIRNMGDGKTPGRGVRVTTLEALTAVASQWHSSIPSPEIFDYAVDETTPTTFWVAPVPADNVHVDIKFSVEPAELTSPTEELGILPIFSEALREYALYRMYVRNDAVIDYQGRANLHLQRFFSLLGQEAQARLLTSPLNEIFRGNQIPIATGG